MIRTSSAIRRSVGFLLAIGLVFAGTDRAGAEQPFSFEATPGKLPKGVVPVAYRIDLTPNVDTLAFTGREQVDIVVAAPTDTITLNASALTFTSVVMLGQGGAKAEVTLDEKSETAAFKFPHQLAAGRHTLEIDYSGSIIAQPHGLYYNDYDTPQGRQRMLITQFEATDARDMFPGWDEPVFKATYKLSVVLPNSFAAVSNTPIEKEEPAGADGKGKPLKKVTFGLTPKMSSYLLVLAAGPLERIHEAAAAAETGVWTVIGKSEQGQYALHAAAQILPYYNDYFAVPYPLPKLDLIAVPGNFSAGAMENWGGITFIDNNLLFDAATSSPETREAIYSVVAHEMAHQWSGDLVTMAWWDNTWLNEGFATWMAAKATDHFNPSWEIWLRARASKEDAMALDALRTTHPIQQKIADESEIGGAFDSISYKKGAAFIRMIETYLGEATFRDGMRRYMKAHAYSNSTTADLWAALEAASGKPVSKIAAGFTEQPGIPLIQVATACSKGKTVATLTQDRFTIHDPSATKLTWQVPVAIGTVGGAAPRTLLIGDKPQSVSFAGCGAPVQANFGDVGYYRVHYDEAGLKALAASYPSLPAANRATLTADQWAMVQAGRSDIAGYLDLTRHLGGETELVVWNNVIGALRQIDDLTRGTPEREAFHAYARQLLHPVLDRLGWEPRPDEPSEASLLRSDAIEMLGRLGDDDVIAESRRRFATFLENPASLPPTIRAAVVTTVGRYADQATYDQLRALGKAASGTEEKLRYYYALASAQTPALIDQDIQIALTDEISNGRVNRFLAYAARESGDAERVWNGLLGNLDPILQKLGRVPGAGGRSRLLPSVAGASLQPETAAALLTQPETQSSIGARKDADRAVEDISAKVEFRQRLLPALAVWLHANGGS
jgi:aminopeptidase N